MEDLIKSPEIETNLKTEFILKLFTHLFLFFEKYVIRHAKLHALGGSV